MNFQNFLQIFSTLSRSLPSFTVVYHGQDKFTLSIFKYTSIIIYNSSIVYCGCLLHTYFIALVFIFMRGEDGKFTSQPDSLDPKPVCIKLPTNVRKWIKSKGTDFHRDLIVQAWQAEAQSSPKLVA